MFLERLNKKITKIRKSCPEFGVPLDYKDLTIFAGKTEMKEIEAMSYSVSFKEGTPIEVTDKYTGNLLKDGGGKQILGFDLVPVDLDNYFELAWIAPQI